MSEDDEFSDDKVIEDGDQGTKELEEVTSDDNDEPEIKEFHLVKKAQFLPVLIPVQMGLHFRFLKLCMLVAFHILLVRHVVFRHRVDLFPGKCQTDRADQQYCQVYGY